jgi:uracil-DNA glycosylase family 4
MKTPQVIQEEIIQCRKCPRLVNHRELIARKKRRQYMDWTYWGRPVPSFGDPEARLLLIGLAPAAHGGNRTGRIFTGDRSGDWLFRVLHETGFANQPISTHRGDGLALKDCYITAIVHCAPPDNKPARDEIINCRAYLIEEITMLRQVRVVMALGRIAFDHYLDACQALGWPRPSPRPRFGHGKVYQLFGITLIASYHPSQQNTLTGRLTRQMLKSVFIKARELLNR